MTASAEERSQPVWVDGALRPLSWTDKAVVLLMCPGRLERLREVVAALDRRSGTRPAAVLRSTSGLFSLPAGGTALLRLNADEIPTLNLSRQGIAERRLHLVLWADDDAVEELRSSGLDLLDWVSKTIAVPAGSPDWAVANVSLALAVGATISWAGTGLFEVLDAIGMREKPPRLSARQPLQELVDAVDAAGLPLVSDVDTSALRWRIEHALALAGKGGPWIALDPGEPLAGAWRLHATCTTWDDAAERLAAAGCPDPDRLAVELALEPEAIDLAIKRARGDVVEPAGASTVAVGMVPAPLARPLAVDEIRAEVTSLAQRVDPPEQPAQRAVWAAGAQPWRPDQPLDGPTLCRVLRGLQGVPRPPLLHAIAGAGHSEVAAVLGWRATQMGQHDGLITTAEALARTGAQDRAVELLARWLDGSEAGQDEERRFRVLVLLADGLRTLGEAPQALQYYEDGLALAQRLVCAEPGRSDLQRDLSVSFERLGDLHQALGDDAAALRYFKDGLAISRRLADAEPDRLDRQRDLWVFYNKLGDLHRALGDAEGARRSYEPALAIAATMAQREPERADLQRALSSSHERLGDLLRVLGDGPGARKQYEPAVDIRRALVAGEPTRADLQRDLAVSCSKLGDLYQALGDGEHARKYYEDALDIRTTLVKREPGRADLQRDLSVSYERLGDLHRALGDGEHARKYYEDSLDIAKTLVKREPGRADLQRDLSVSYSKLGDLHRALGDGEHARKYYQDALDIAKTLVKREPGRADLQRDLAVSCSKLGDLHRALGDGELARKYYEDALDIRKTLVKREPGRADLQRDLAISFERMAAVDRDAAAGWLDQAIIIHQRRLEQHPANATIAGELAVVLVQRAFAEQGTVAQQPLLQGYALLRQLADRGALDAQYRPMLDRLEEMGLRRHMVGPGASAGR